MNKILLMLALFVDIIYIYLFIYVKGSLKLIHVHNGKSVA